MSGFSSHSRSEQGGDSQRPQRDTRGENHTRGTGGGGPDVTRRSFEHGEGQNETPPVSNRNRLADLLRTVREGNSRLDTPATNTASSSHPPEGTHQTARDISIVRSRANLTEGDRNTNPGESSLRRTSLRDLLSRQDTATRAIPDDQLSTSFPHPEDIDALPARSQDNDWQSTVTDTTVTVNNEDGNSFHGSRLHLAEHQHEGDGIPQTYGLDSSPDRLSNAGEDRAEPLLHTDTSDSNSDRLSNAGQDRTEPLLRDSESDMLTIADDPARIEKEEKIERMGSDNTRSKALIALLEEHYGDNVVFQHMKQYIQREEIKIRALRSDLDKTNKERSNNIKQWKYRRRADLQQSRENRYLRSLIDYSSFIFLPAIGELNIYSRIKKGPTIGQQAFRPIRAYQHREGHRLQATFGSAERTPLQDQEFPGRNWQRPENVDALSEEIQERNNLLESLNQARETASLSEFTAQKYSPEEQRCLDDISDAIYSYSGRGMTRYINDKLLSAFAIPGEKPARQQLREEIILLKQDLRLRTRVGEGDIDEQKAHTAAREDIFYLPTSTLKKTARLLLKEKEYRDQEQQQGTSADIRQGKTTLFEREAREHAAFGINEKQLEILIEESIQELASRRDAKKLTHFLQYIQYESQSKDAERRYIRPFSAFLKQESSHLTHTIKNMKWMRIIRGGAKNRSIEVALQKTIFTQRTALDSLSFSPSTEQEESIDPPFFLTAVTRTIMNLDWSPEAFMWYYLHRGVTVINENQQELEQSGVQLINALSNHEIQVLLQRHRRCTDRHQSIVDSANALCKDISDNIAEMERPDLSHDESKKLKDLKDNLKFYEEKRAERLSDLNTYREHTESFLDLVAKSRYQNLVTYDESMQRMI